MLSVAIREEGINGFLQRFWNSDQGIVTPNGKLVWSALPCDDLLYCDHTNIMPYSFIECQACSMWYSLHEVQNNKLLVKNVESVMAAALFLLKGTGVAGVYSIYDPESEVVSGEVCGRNLDIAIAVGAVADSLADGMSEVVGYEVDFDAMYGCALLAKGAGCTLSEGNDGEAKHTAA